MNSSSSANSTIRAIRCASSRRAKSREGPPGAARSRGRSARREMPSPSSRIGATRPTTTTRPELGGMTRAMTRRSVLLPAPFRPTTPMTPAARPPGRHVAQRLELVEVDPPLEPPYRVFLERPDALARDQVLGPRFSRRIAPPMLSRTKANRSARRFEVTQPMTRRPSAIAKERPSSVQAGQDPVVDRLAEGLNQVVHRVQPDGNPMPRRHDARRGTRSASGRTRPGR